MTQMLPQIRASNVKPIAVTSAERSEAAPDVPTLQEAGLSDYEVLQWWGVLAPAGLPEETVAKLNTDINKVLATQKMKDFLAHEGGTPRQMSQPAFADRKSAGKGKRVPVRVDLGGSRHLKKKKTNNAK